MDQQEKKKRVAAAAMAFLEEGMVLGVGTGSTVNALLDQLGSWAPRLRGAVSSSEASTRRLREMGVPLVDLNDVDHLGLYIDGADEANGRLQLIKGGGGALTREKIIAGAARRFVCIVDESKLVPVLGRFPLPVEVIAMAAGQLTRRFAALGGVAELRRRADGTLQLTDNGHPLLDVQGLQIGDPLALESEVNQWPGVVTVGVFARHRAHTCLLGTARGVQTLVF